MVFKFSYHGLNLQGDINESAAQDIKKIQLFYKKEINMLKSKLKEL
jgi:hypothetical protein